MFYCAITGKLSKLGESPRKILLAQRERDYTRWVRNEETNKWEEVFVAKGWEIVKEVDATAEGETEWNSWDSDQRWLYLKNYYPHLVKAAEEAEDAVQIESLVNG
jgi:hypothetical protein